MVGRHWSSVVLINLYNWPTTNGEVRVETRVATKQTHDKSMWVAQPLWTLTLNNEFVLVATLVASFMKAALEKRITVHHAHGDGDSGEICLLALWLLLINTGNNIYLYIIYLLLLWCILLLLRWRKYIKRAWTKCICSITIKLMQRLCYSYI